MNKITAHFNIVDTYYEILASSEFGFEINDDIYDDEGRVNKEIITDLDLVIETHKKNIGFEKMISQYGNLDLIFCGLEIEEVEDVD